MTSRSKSQDPSSPSPTLLLSPFSCSQLGRPSKAVVYLSISISVYTSSSPQLLLISLYQPTHSLESGQNGRPWTQKAAVPEGYVFKPFCFPLLVVCDSTRSYRVDGVAELCQVRSRRFQSLRSFSRGLLSSLARTSTAPTPNHPPLFFQLQPHSLHTRDHGGRQSPVLTR